MKKVSVLLCAAVLVIAMTGCGTESIGIIGGSDGPTDVIVDSGKESA